MRTATIDTNIFPASALLARAQAAGIDAKAITVSTREVSGSSLQAEVAELQQVLEPATWDESPWDKALWAGDIDSDRLEEILAVLSNGAFPPADARGGLSNGQRRQLRDAMILEAHLREEREVLVTNDRRAYINHGRREQLQQRFSTRIMTVEEFEAMLDEGAAV